MERVLLAQNRWRLSVRQTRVLELVATGMSNKEIAVVLACTEATVENHMTELFRRSGATSRAGVVGRLLAD
jgi:DNA-binding NarL/FixJ family response regulator